MPIRKGQKHYSKQFIASIMNIHYEKGKSITETAKMLNLDRVVVKNAINRENRKKNKLKNDPMIFSKIGKPRKKPITKQRELELENAELKREIDLLKSFLQAAGRM